MWVYVSTTYYCCRVDADENRNIIDAAPITHWAIGKNLDWFKQYLENKGVLLEWLEYD